ncbi:MAG: hypothetical protein QME12_05930 [Nanoarchaeota archaeon]|nr:hypothetical protein [Nanoarchaeota archaeon]
MYAAFETNTSYKYLKETIKALHEPICILGGWAVFFHVNRRFKEAQGREYLGSRDIDLGFHFNKNASARQIRQSSMAKALHVLQDKLKFKPISFRLFKEIHIETGKELENGEKVPLHLIFPMYVDPIVDFVPKQFKSVFHFVPIDEPLLRFVFENEANRAVLEEFNKKLWLPKPEIIVAAKISAVRNRDKEHKKIKDICDIFALLWYAGEEPNVLCRKAAMFLAKSKIKESLSILNNEDYEKAAHQLGHGQEQIKSIIELLSK